MQLLRRLVDANPSEHAVRPLVQAFGRRIEPLLAGIAQPKTKYDVFVAAPMAALSDEESYRKTRADVLGVIEALKGCGFQSVFYAGQDIPTKADFDLADISAEDDFGALAESRFFVLVYPERVASSALFEAGAAVASGKPSVSFVRDRNALPFLMHHAEQAFPTVKIYEYATLEDILRAIRKHGTKLFSPRPR